MRRRASVVGLAVFGLATLIAVSPETSASAASKAGDAKVVTPADNAAGQTPLTSGTTATPFSLQLPAQAACPGDSNNGGYRVQSYMVPASVDPATLQFGSVGPVPTGTGNKFRQALFDVNTNQYVNAQTAMATHPGGPGPIINIPAFNFSVFKAGDVPAGLYNAGIACTKGPPSSSQLDKYWNAQMKVTAGPGGVAWSTPGSSSGAGSGGGAPAAADAAAAVAPGSSAGVTGPGGNAGGPATGVPANPTGPAHHSTATKPSGAPPSFGNSFGEVWAFIPIPGSSALGLALWTLIVVVVARVAFLVLRRPFRALGGGPITAPPLLHLEDR